MQSLDARLVVFISINHIGNIATFLGKKRLDWKSDDGLPVESVTGAEALHAGDVADTLRRAVAHRWSGHGRYLGGGRRVFGVCCCCEAGKRGHEIVSFQRSSPRDSRCVAIGSDVGVNITHMSRICYAYQIKTLRLNEFTTKADIK